MDAYDRILTAIKKYIPICRDGRIYDEHAADGVVARPKAAGVFEEWCLKKGVPRSACIEVPDYVPLERRVRALVAAMEEIVKM